MSEFTKELEDYFCKFTFGQFVTLILLELVTLFFVFYLGARYGPDLLGGRKVAVEETERPTETPKVEYTYPTTLAESPNEGGAIKVKPSGMSAKEYEEGLRVVVPAPEPVPVEPVAVAPEAPPVSRPAKSGDYAIQVGSYPSAEEAAQAVDRWKGKGYETFMTIGEIPNKGTWYRVRIGRFKDKDEAKVFLEKFKQREKSDGLVVLSKS